MRQKFNTFRGKKQVFLTHQGGGVPSSLATHSKCPYHWNRDAPLPEAIPLISAAMEMNERVSAEPARVIWGSSVLYLVFITFFNRTFTSPTRKSEPATITVLSCPAASRAFRNALWGSGSTDIFS